MGHWGIGLLGHWAIGAEVPARLAQGNLVMAASGLQHFRWGGETGVPENKFCPDVEESKAYSATMPHRLSETSGQELQKCDGES